jgi:hypothetical protein
MRRFRFVFAIKYLILLGAIIFSCLLISGLEGSGEEKDFIGFGIAVAGCVIAYALIDNNDVREANKD